jgi:hypothetical protein
MVDNSERQYFGTGPEIGAREVGSERVFGGLISACPGL